MCGLNLQQFIFISQECLTIQDTINPDFNLADNFKHILSFSKQRISHYYQFLWWTLLLILITLILLTAKVNSLFKTLILCFKKIYLNGKFTEVW